MFCETFAEFGHFIPLVMPVLNAVKSSELELCSFTNLDKYLTRQVDGSPISKFYGFDWWHDERTGFNSKKYPIEVSKFIQSKREYWYWPTSQWNHAENYKFYCLHNKIIKRMSAPILSQYKDSIVLSPRKRWISNHVPIEFWKFIIDKLSKTYTLYLAGSQHETFDGLGNSNCHYIYNMEDPYNKHIDILNNCAASVCSVGGCMFLSIFTGAPTLVIGPEMFSNFADKSYPFYPVQFNPLGTTLEYLSNNNINYSILYDKIIDFIKNSSNNKDNIKDIVEIGPVDLYKLHH